jgi:hypothetical protein
MQKYTAKKFVERHGNDGQTCSFTQPNSVATGCVNGVQTSFNNLGGVSRNIASTGIAAYTGGAAGIVMSLALNATLDCGAGVLNTAAQNCQVTYSPSSKVCDYHPLPIVHTPVQTFMPNN